MNQDQVISFVPGLLLASGPMTIFWAVISVVVDAVDRMLLRRTFAHVIEKRLKGISPSFAYGYAACAVFVKAVAFWIVASLNHCCPAVVDVRAAMTVRTASIDRAISPQASTTFCVSAGQFGRSYDCFGFVLAIAFAKPTA